MTISLHVSVIEQHRGSRSALVIMHQYARSFIRRYKEARSRRSFPINHLLQTTTQFGLGLRLLPNSLKLNSIGENVVRNILSTSKCGSAIAKKLIFIMPDASPPSPPPPPPYSTETSVSPFQPFTYTCACVLSDIIFRTKLYE